jgi:superfamily II DNA helicase RecQ
MQIKLFTIPVSDAGVFQEELNRFLRTNKVLEVENQLISNERGASWCFCVKYVGSDNQFPHYERGKPDYKTILDEATFKIFERLRDIRKILGAEDAVPAYSVCTDTELTAIAKLNEINLQNLKTIKGFGDKKLEKYGSRLIQLLQKTNLDEKSGKLV